MKNTNWFKLRAIVLSFSERAFMLSHFRQFKFSQDEYKNTKEQLMTWIEKEALPDLENVIKDLYTTKGSGHELLSAAFELKKILKCYFELSACMADDGIRKELFSIQEHLLYSVEDS